MAGSMKDALRKSGIAPKALPAQKLEKKKFLEELPDDQSLPPLFDAPARTKIKEPPPRPKKA